MKKTSIFIIFLSAILLLFAFNGCELSAKCKNFEIQILDCEESFDEFEGNLPDNDKDSYKLMKVNCSVKNTNDCSVYMIETVRHKDNDVFIPKQYLFIEPTYPVSKEQTVNQEFYVYVSKNVDNEQACKLLKKYVDGKNNLLVALIVPY